MWEIEQPTVGEETGTCLAACVASIFEVPLSQCEAIFPPNNYSQQLMNWTTRHYPMLRCLCRDYGTNHRSYRDPEEDNLIWTYDLPEREIPRHEGYWIGIFESPRIVMSKGSYKGMKGLHAVVMQYNRIVWDPHPQRDMGLGRIAGEHRWAVIDPSKI